MSFLTCALEKCQDSPSMLWWALHADNLPEKLIEYGLHESILRLSRLPVNPKRYLTLSTWQSNRASWVNWSWFFYLSRFILYPSKSHPNPQLILLCLFSVQNMPLFRSLKRDTPRLQNVFKLRYKTKQKISRYTKSGQSSSLLKVIRNWPYWSYALRTSPFVTCLGFIKSHLNKQPTVAE